MDTETLKYLQEISNEKLMWLELGMQTTNENTLKVINRGYTHKIFDEKIKELKEKEILFLIHAIFGLPYENKDDYLNTINYIKNIYPFGVKFHNLYICKNTPIYHMYLNKSFNLISKEEYISTVIYAIKQMPPNTVIHRITGDPNKSTLYKPNWCGDKLSIISEIDKRLKLENIDIKTEKDIKIAVDYWKK